MMKNLLLPSLMFSLLVGCSSGPSRSDLDQYRDYTGGRTMGDTDCVWFQHTDQVVYFGSYQDSHFDNKSMLIPEEFTSRQSGNSVTFVPFPMLRPGRVMNDKRVNRAGRSG